MIYIKHNIFANGDIFIGGSKSISNRLLILNHLFKGKIYISNISQSDDTKLLINALNSKKNDIYIGNAGTCMRFLTSFFSIYKESNITLRGSKRMEQRPIKKLVDALTALGANIQYLKKEGYPPIKITGRKLVSKIIDIDSNISSQYISSLMMIGCKIENGLTINLKKQIYSQPYINMTFNILKRIGVNVQYLSDRSIFIPFTEDIHPIKINVESDWSSASYYFSIISLTKNSTISLNNFYKKSYQGDSIIKNIYNELFGVQYKFEQGKIILNKIKEFKYPKKIKLNLINNPDIAQTIIATCVGLKIKFHITGINSLKIKETDRIKAMQKEILKFGVISKTDESSIRSVKFINIKNKSIIIDTYKDHRMAMSLTPLFTKFNLFIKDENVITKSYSKFWEDINNIKQITQYIK